ncbi:MAG: alpha/beta fold hydrolase [bacterium]|nr:alpha/beta fold hydrolase [bacterium]
MIEAIALPGWATTQSLFAGIQLPTQTHVAPNTTHDAIAIAKETLLSAPQPIDVIGFSMGAMIIAQWLQDPACQENIKSAHLIAPFPHYSAESLAPIYTQLDTHPQAAMDAFYRAGFQGIITPSIRAQLDHWKSQLDAHALRKTLDYLATINLTQYEYSNNTIPVTWTHGLNDQIAPYAPTKRFFKSWGNLTHVPAPNFGHFLIQEGYFASL